jgi:hypothetical protein
VERSILAALSAVVGQGRGVSVATKMLHLKRTRLFPILDRLVVEVLGGSLAEDAAPEIRARLAANLVLHVRTEGIRNLDALRASGVVVRDVDGMSLTRCRASERLTESRPVGLRVRGSRLFVSGALPVEAISRCRARGFR